MKKRQFIIQIFLLILVFTVFSFFRFYHLEKRIIFNWDQESFSYQIRNIIVNHKLTLLGPRVVSDTGFFLAPYFTYLLIPFYLISQLHPNGLIYFLIVFNILFFFVSFYVIKKIFGFYQAFSFLFLWAINPLLIAYDIIPWWPLTIPLGVVTVWFILYLIFQKNKTIYWIILGITLGFFINMHFQFVFIVLFSLIFIAIYYLKKKFFSFQKTAFLFLGFLIMFLPLLIFDLRHNFLNFHNFINFFSPQNILLAKDPNVWFTVFNHFLYPLIFTFNETVTKIFYSFILISLFFLTIKKRNFFKLFYLSNLILWVIFPLCFALYGKRPSEYYFVFLYPLILLILIELFFYLKQKPLFFFLCLVLISFNKSKIIDTLKPDIFGLYYKDKTIKEVKKLTEGKKFNISFNMPLGADVGYRYLIDHYQIKQTGNWKDPLVEIRIPPKKGDIRIKEIGIKIPKELK